MRSIFIYGTRRLKLARRAALPLSAAFSGSHSPIEAGCRAAYLCKFPTGQAAQQRGP